MTTLLMALIAVFSLQRCLYAVVALWRSRPAAPHAGPWPRVAVVLASRDEEDSLAACLESLAALDYPEDRLTLVLVSDGSRDGTADAMTRFAAARPRTRVMSAARSVGKAAALNRAIAAVPDAAFVGVYDTDLRPAADSLRRLVAACLAPGVGAASGIRVPVNRGAGAVAAYAALESDVHQWVTLRSRHLLGWNPQTTGGNCVYRREALLGVGWFRPGALSEDTEMSLGLAGAGWRTVFVEEAVAFGEVAESWRQFTRQRLRWTSGLYASARAAHGWQGWLTAAGYVDRLLFLWAGAAVWAGLLHPAWLLAYLIPPVMTAVVATARSGHLAVLPHTLRAAVMLFPWDVLLSTYATMAALGGCRPAWQPARRDSRS
jgi:cellulose synthase/poly-beta-1,6-N-acetylglucosamine synthase-like glycosyltransferase